ncbi:GapR family DNA-binding domain-containing protein [Paenirhodobacter enshiensis]|uniref:GapR family DNA-binding domain-containing protein n=1 Tax=Paenirhodobacter enshiensis TaxID=1105367 RepID=UPI003FA2FBB6
MLDMNQADPAADFYARAVALVRAEDRASTTFLQKSFSIGYARAAALIEQLEAEGIVSAADTLGKRTVHPEADKPAPRPVSANPAGAEVQTTMADLIALGKVNTGGKVPVKNTDADKAVSDSAYAVTADELRQFIEQYESLEAEKQDIAEQMKDVMAEAKGRGYDTKVIKRIIAIRKRDRDDVAEEEAVFDLYKQALGMA